MEKRVVCFVLFCFTCFVLLSKFTHKLLLAITQHRVATLMSINIIGYLFFLLCVSSHADAQRIGSLHATKGSNPDVYFIGYVGVFRYSTCENGRGYYIGSIWGYDANPQILFDYILPSCTVRNPRLLRTCFEQIATRLDVFFYRMHILSGNALYMYLLYDNSHILAV